MADEGLKEAALYFHKHPRPGKLTVEATKPLATQRDLSLAYSPGVAYACMAIVEDPNEVRNMTARGNLVGVITNGTAVLGLGNIGPLASKPVMEGKAVLFKKFAYIDVFDLEVDELDVDKFCDVVASLEPTFGGINLEDIKAPECFEIEEKLRARMNIPVFHDDQHGTAIIVAAAILSGLRCVDKKLEDIKLVTSGAGAAALACLKLLVSMGVKYENITVTDIDGVVYKGRAAMNPHLEVFAQDTDARTLGEVMDGADVFLGLSAPGVLKQDMVKKMAKDPLVLALANPDPEITPEDVRAVRPDALICTGRSDYPNQVNNVLCFPYIFRGALDVGATTINEEMKIAAVEAIADLAQQEASDIVASAYGGEAPSFGPEYLIPKPFDPRLILEIAPRVARAAMDSGVATMPMEDFDWYHEKLSQFVYRSGQVMRPVVLSAKQDPKRIAFAEGEQDRILRAAQSIVDEGIARPLLIGRRDVIAGKIEELHLRLKPDEDIEIVDMQNDDRLDSFAATYHEMMARRGVAPDRARQIMRNRPTAISSVMVCRGEADAGICGAIGRWRDHLVEVIDVIGPRSGVHRCTALSLLIMPQGPIFILDTHVNPNPSTSDLVEMVGLATTEVRSFGIEPKVALLSHSNFGSSNLESAVRMRESVAALKKAYPNVEIEGEMHADAALSEATRDRAFPGAGLTGAANLLVMPGIDSANISFNLLKTLGRGLSVGPILLGTAYPMHILTSSVTVRGIINMAAVAVVDAQEHHRIRAKKG
ncbi:NADP-dependent malic enzyme [uncultured Nisaea sp.]|uniref:NADP-dependent malic enzyme n=1 Tax=uncultured Nisaea sp. TaxID=538215 RepID=UPI0030EF4435